MICIKGDRRRDRQVESLTPSGLQQALERVFKQTLHPLSLLVKAFTPERMGVRRHNETHTHKHQRPAFNVTLTETQILVKHAQSCGGVSMSVKPGARGGQHGDKDTDW